MIHEGQFDYLNGTVTVPAEADPLWFKDELAPFYYHPNDERWAKTLCRVLYHESIHFWHFLASGYLANLVGEEWRRIKDYEKTGEISEVGRMKKKLRYQEKDLPFSPYELMECWARYWDVHTRSPAEIVRESGLEASSENLEIDRGGVVLNYTHKAFDLVMQRGKDCEYYAVPYRWILREASGSSRLVNFTFPIIAHYAFGSPDPVRVFCKAFERAILSSELRAEVAQASGAINLEWLKMWQDVYQKSVYPILNEMGMPMYTSGFDVISRGTLRDHPVFSEYPAQLVPLRANLNLFLMNIGIEKPKNDEELEQYLTGHMALDNFGVIVGLPGQPSYRYLLGKHFPPPRVRFENFTYIARRPLPFIVGASNQDEDNTYQQRLNELDERIKRFRAAEAAKADDS